MSNFLYEVEFLHHLFFFNFKRINLSNYPILHPIPSSKISHKISDPLVFRSDLFKYWQHRVCMFKMMSFELIWVLKKSRIDQEFPHYFPHFINNAATLQRPSLSKEKATQSTQADKPPHIWYWFELTMIIARELFPLINLQIVIWQVSRNIHFWTKKLQKEYKWTHSTIKRRVYNCL